MNPNTMPPWLIDYLEDNTGFNRPGKFGYPYYTATQESDAVVDFYKFISKPENLVKIPEVAKLINAHKNYLPWLIDDMKTNDCTCGADDWPNGSVDICPQHRYMKETTEALKPFKGGE